jgi:hypothetical protein
MLPEGRALHETQKTLRTEATLRDLLRALEPAGVPFVVLKGVHLAAVYYARPEDRPHQDVDILVRLADFARACEALPTVGFQRRPPAVGRAATAREFYNQAFVSRSGIPVELHRDWAGYGRYRLDAEGLFARACHFHYGQTAVLGLAPEDLLLYLCVHMAKSYFATIERKHVQDLGVMLARDSIDWPSFLARTRAARCRCGSYYALCAAAEQCQAGVPREVMDALRPGAWRRWWIERTLDPRRFPLCAIPNSQMWRIQTRLALPLLDRPSDWVRVLARYLRIRVEDWAGSRRPATP